jgi:hypothetical protein
MALNDIEAARARKALNDFLAKRRPPPHIRPKLDLGYRIKGQSIELFEIRPVWRGKAGDKREHPFAKATYVRATGIWRVFWLRADLKWHSYPPAPAVGSIEHFLKLVVEDKHACFFG